MRRRVFVQSAALLAGLAAVPMLRAQQKYPNKPIKFVKEWGAATPELRAMKAGYDVKKVEGSGARVGSGDDGWTAVSLTGAEGICAAAARATKTRSNIQNN